VRVLFDLTAPPADWRALGDNFRVEVHIVAWQADPVLRAPTAALFRRGDRWAAFVVEDGKARARTLEIGEQSPEIVEIRGGARDGEQVVLRPGESLRDGMRVEGATAN
jgi:HlyD family secretion protein